MASIPLSALTDSLQAAPPQLRWAYADQGLLRSVAHDLPVQRGSRGKWLYRLLAMADAVGCEWGLLKVLALLQLMLLQRQFRRGSAAGAEAVHLFVGFGAGAEESLYRQFSADANGKVARVDQTRLSSFQQLMPIGWREQHASLLLALAQARQAVAALPTPLAVHRLDFLRFVGIRVVQFAYCRAWFAAFKRSRLLPQAQVAFMAQDTAAFAACEQQLPCMLLQHGLMFHLVMPEFTRVKALTIDEACWLKRVLPHASIELPSLKQQIDVGELCDKVLIASIYGTRDFLALVMPFVEWAHSHGVPLVVRPHPREEHRFWQETAAGASLQIDGSKETFVAALLRQKPRVVVSWYSTTLAEALQMGIIPVTVCPLDDVNVADMVYPLFGRALQWPRDADTLQRVLADADCYRQVLAQLRGSEAGARA